MSHRTLPRLLCLALCGSLPTASASAFEPPMHLLPVAGPFDPPTHADYRSLVLSHFPCPTRRWLQLMILPSNQPEESVSVEGTDLATASLVHVRAKRSIWIARSEPPPGATRQAPVSIPVERHVAALDGAVQTRLVRAWVALIRGAHYGPFTDAEDDGASYYFSAFIPHYGVIVGKSWSPPAGSLPGLFVRLGTLLGEYADADPAKRPAIQKDLERTLRSAERQLGL